MYVSGGRLINREITLRDFIIGKAEEVIGYNKFEDGKYRHLSVEQDTSLNHIKESKARAEKEYREFLNMSDEEIQKEIDNLKENFSACVRDTELGNIYLEKIKSLDKSSDCQRFVEFKEKLINELDTDIEFYKEFDLLDHITIEGYKKNREDSYNKEISRLNEAIDRCYTHVKEINEFIDKVNALIETLPEYSPEGLANEDIKRLLK